MWDLSLHRAELFQEPVALLLRHSLKLEKAALAVEAAVAAVLDRGLRCADIAGQGSGAAKEKVVGTVAMGAAVVEAVSGGRA